MIGELLSLELGSPRHSIGQTEGGRSRQNNSRLSARYLKSKTAFMNTQFCPTTVSNNLADETACELRKSRTFNLCDAYIQARSNDQCVHVNTAYKRKADKIRPVDLGESTGEGPGGLSNWWDVMWEHKMQYPERIETDPPHRYDKYIIPRFSQLARGARLTPERIERLQICADLLPDEKEFLLEILHRREESLAWEFSEVNRICREVAPPQKIRTIPHQAWQAPSFPIPRGLLRTVIDMLRDRIDSGIYEPCDGPYRNPWFLVKKKSGKYRIVNAAMNINKYTVRDANLPPNMEEFAEEFAGMAISSMIDFFSGYDQVELDPESRDMTAFQTPMGLLRQTTLPQGTTNSPAQFSRITRKILERNIPHDCESYFDDVGVKGPKTKYDEEEIFPGVRRYIFEHLQRLDRTLVSIELAGARISGSKSQ